MTNYNWWGPKDIQEQEPYSFETQPILNIPDLNYLRIAIKFDKYWSYCLFLNTFVKQILTRSGRQWLQCRLFYLRFSEITLIFLYSLFFANDKGKKGTSKERSL